MFPLTDKKEKEEKIDPKRIDKVPENRPQGESQVILNRIQMPGILIHHPDQNDNAGKDVQKVGSRNDV